MFTNGPQIVSPQHANEAFTKGNPKVALVLLEVVNAMQSGAFLFEDLKRFRFCPRTNGLAFPFL